jgi:outer membrane receptor protein involved in Fe transport
MGQSYNTSITDAPPFATDYTDRVNAAFVEFEVPLYDTVSAQIAARHENFIDQNIDTTTPKVALRWEALPELALRASWGESFLAPDPGTNRPFNANEGCGEVFAGLDPLTGNSLAGSQSCSSGNPDIKPETSEIMNIGFTWEPLDELSLSVDYQTIDYSDRIRSLSTVDSVELQFARMLEATGISEADYDATPGSDTREAANAWLASQPSGELTAPGIQRDPTDQSVVKTVRNPANIAEVMIDLIDVKSRYRIPTNNWGTFVTTLTASYFTKYEYVDLSGETSDARGKQNGDSGIVPPLPKLKANLRLNWFKNAHSASVSANYQHHVVTDGSFFAFTTGIKPARTIQAQTLVNAQYSYIFDDLFDSEVTLSAGVNNMFDQRAQRLPQLGGMETRLQTPFGRQFWVSVDWTPGF